jgi:hypothetical protein
MAIKPTTTKPDPGFRLQILDPLRAAACAEHEQASLEAFSADQAAQDSAAGGEENEGEDHRVQRVGPPKGQPRKGKGHNRLEDNPQRHRHQQARNRKAERLQRIGSINPHGHAGHMDRGRKSEQLPEPVTDIIDMHPDLVRPDHPRRFGCHDKQTKVDYREKQNRVGNIMFEKPDHGVGSHNMSDFLTAKGKVSINFTPLFQVSGTKRFFAI